MFRDTLKNIKKNYKSLIANLNYPNSSTLVITYAIRGMKNDTIGLKELEKYLENLSDDGIKIHQIVKHYILGCYYYCMENWEQAEYHLAKSFEGNPQFIKSYSNYVNDGTHLCEDSGAFLKYIPSTSGDAYKILTISTSNAKSSKSPEYALISSDLNLKLDKNNPETYMNLINALLYQNKGILTDKIFENIQSMCTLSPEKYFCIPYKNLNMDPDTTRKFIELGKNLLNYTLDRETKKFINIHINISSLLLKSFQNHNFHKEMIFIAQNLPKIKDETFNKNLVDYLISSPLIKKDESTKNYILGCCYSNMKEYKKANYCLEKAFTYNTSYADDFNEYFNLTPDEKINCCNNLEEILAKNKCTLIKKLNAYISNTPVNENKVELKDLEKELKGVDIFSLDLNKIFYTEKIDKNIDARKSEIATIMLENVDFKKSVEELKEKAEEIKNKVKMILWDTLLRCDKNTLETIYSPLTWIEQGKAEEIHNFFNPNKDFWNSLNNNIEKINQLNKFVSILENKASVLKNDTSNLSSIQQFENNFNQARPSKIKISTMKILKVLQNFIEMCKNFFKKKEQPLEKIEIKKQLKIENNIQ